MSDSFIRQAAIEPVAIDDISVVLFDPGPENTTGMDRSATVNVQVRMSNGVVYVQRANLANHLDGQTIQQLIALVTFIRAEANRLILPAPDQEPLPE